MHLLVKCETASSKKRREDTVVSRTCAGLQTRPGDMGAAAALLSIADPNLP